MNIKEALFGQPHPRPIVAIDRNQTNPGILTSYFRNADGTTTAVHRPEPHYLIVSQKDAEKISHSKIVCPTQELNGPNPLNVLLTPERGNEYMAILKMLDRDKVVSLRGHRAMMVKHNVNMFYGMEFDDVRRLYFDLEVLSSGQFPDARKPNDQIIIISVLTTYKDTAEETLFRLDEYTSEQEMLETFVAYFRRMDPDIVLNHNIFGFDLPYLKERCLLNGVKLALGRDGSAPGNHPATIKFAEKNDDYENYTIHGRHVLDTFFMAKSYDAVKRELPSYGLKAIVKYLGKASDDRVYIEGKDITAAWNDPFRREELCKYAMDDVREARILDVTFGQSVFYSTQFIPMSHQEVFRYGTGTKIDSIFLRHYIRSGEAWPLPDPKREYGGGYAGCPVKGYVPGKLIYADVKSLYPTLAQLLDIQPPKDTLGFYKDSLDELKKIRYEADAVAKKLKTAGDKEGYERENAKQNAYKVLINTLSYGWLGWEHGAFNHYDGAESITVNGQDILKTMIAYAESTGHKVIKFDTDGMLVQIGDMDPDTFIQDINAHMAPIIEMTFGPGKSDLFLITNDGVYLDGIMFDSKGYVLRDERGKLKVRGNTLKSRSTEPFVNELLIIVVQAVLEQRMEDILPAYQSVKDRIVNRELRIEELRKRSTLNMSPHEYLAKRSAGTTNMSGQYEIAYVQKPKVYQKGDPIEYYVADPGTEWHMKRNGEYVERKSRKRVAEKTRLAELYANDYDVDHYVERLHEGVKRLLPIFGESQFNAYFPDVKLTKKDKEKLQENETDSRENDGLD